MAGSRKEKDDAVTAPAKRVALKQTKKLPPTDVNRALADVSWRVALAVALPFALGYWADRQFETAPWGVVVGALAGVMLSFVLTLRISREIERNNRV